MREWVFLAFLIIAAWQDTKEREVSVWLYIVFGLVLALSSLCSLFDVWQMQGAEICLKMLFDIMCSLCLGLALVGLSILMEGGIGMGDAVCFVVSSFAFGFWENLLLLASGLFLCSGYGICRMVWSGKLYIRKAQVAFLPFLLPASIFLVLMRFGI